MNQLNQPNQNKRKLDDINSENIYKPNKKQKLDVDLDDLFCPMTKQIFYHPVTANDGFTYEKWALIKLFNGNIEAKSPMTRETINYYCDNKFIENTIRSLLENDLSLKELQFDKNNYDSYEENKQEFMQYIRQRKFSELTRFNNIILNDQFQNNMNIIGAIIKHINLEDFKKIIDKSVDLYTYSNNSVPLRLICINGNLDMIKYVLDKPGAIEHIYKLDADIILDILFTNQAGTVINYLIDNNKYNIDKIMNNNNTLFDLLFNINFKLFIKLLENYINDENKIWMLFKPCHLKIILKHCDYDIIIKFLDILDILFVDSNKLIASIIENFELSTKDTASNIVLDLSTIIYNDNNLNKKQKINIINKLCYLFNDKIKLIELNKKIIVECMDNLHKHNLEKINGYINTFIETSKIKLD